MVPRQQFTSVAYALKAGSLINITTTTTSIMPDPIPQGLIAMWNGSSDAIPEGWALCDGNNGTPNLTDKFIIGAGKTYSVEDDNIGDSAFSDSFDLEAAYFCGNAPTMGTAVFDGCALEFIVYYMDGMTGFESPFYTYTAMVSPTGECKPGAEKTCPATKVLGRDSQTIEKLRLFRDGTLKNFAIGRMIIRSYYDNAESINGVIDRSPVLRVMARKMLRAIAPIVGDEKEY